MALGLIAGIGMALGGAGAKLFGDKVDRNQFSDIIGAPPEEQAGPRREQYQGRPLMSPGTGLMGGELNPMQAASEMMQMGGRYGKLGQDLIQQYMQPKTPRNLQTVQSGAPGEMQTTMQLLPNGQAVPIPGLQPRKAGGGITIQNMPDLPAGYMATDPTDLSKGVIPIPGGPKDETFPGTGEEKTAYGFLQRQEAASTGMADLVAADPQQGGGGLLDFENNLNLTGAQMAAGRMGPSLTESSILNDSQQQYMQFARDWIRAKLRKESGAVINKDEWADEYQAFFPMPGDSEAVIQQKRLSRKVSENSMRTMAGSAAPKQRKPGDTWSDGTYDYRVTESGEIQRKAK